MRKMSLREAEKIEVTILVDNYSDTLLADAPGARRMKVPPPLAPLAEHGLACLISVYKGDESHTILMDGGTTGTCLRHNADLMPKSIGVMTGAIRHRLTSVETVVLSHGHYDHFSGLPQFLAGAGRKVPLIVHPGAFVERRIKLAPDFYGPMPALNEGDLQKAGAIIDKRAEASTIADDLILLTGRVERVTAFETGSPGLEARIDDQWVPDPFEDDQGLAINLKGKGLVVIGGCSHSGIINIIEHACNLSGVDQVHAVLGGWHLSGSSEPKIEQTIEAMKTIGPDIVVPMHCTGWRATNRFAAAMPEQFILNSVGTTYQFGF
jgi:7,8-dihydropterin-6-yl-methyl-4-(beta-D-ribofuranosyl)aminobenzene 5'-phosphate synthase